MIQLPFGGESEGLPPPPDEEEGHEWADLNINVPVVRGGMGVATHRPVLNMQGSVTEIKCTCEFELIVHDYHVKHFELMRFKCPNRHLYDHDTKIASMELSVDSFLASMDRGQLAAEAGDTIVLQNGQTLTLSDS